MTPSGNTILITGGGSGIGRELARRFADQGNQVIVAGRRQEALDETIAGHDGMFAMTVDVDDRDALAAFARRVVADHPTLNVLVNNAGIMRTEDLTRARDLREAEMTVTTNLLGPIRLVDALVEHLAAQPNAAIVNVTSGLAFVPLAQGATYSATKAALHSYTQSLRSQLAGKVEVIELAPPGVQTEFTPGQSTRAGYVPLAEFTDDVMRLFNQQPTPAEIIVDQARPLREAEANGKFDAMMAMVNPPR